MKARVKDTGVELEVYLIDKQARYIGSDGITYWEEDLDFGIEDKNNPDYWTRLEHQAAIAAMQGMLAGTYYQGLSHDRVVEDAQYYQYYGLSLNAGNGHSHSPTKENRKKVSEMRKRTKMSDETKDKIRQAAKKRIGTKYFKNRIEL